MAEGPSDQVRETRVIIAHCMAKENTTDPEYAQLVAQMEQLIENGSVTPKGKCLVASLSSGVSYIEH